MLYWLVKTEPTTFSIRDLKRTKSTLWDQVRNYQARNFLRSMLVGDPVLIYHSNAEPTGVVGAGVVKSVAQADPSQFDKKSEYYDAAATPANPRWFAPEIKFTEEFEAVIELAKLRQQPELMKMHLLRKGNRLSVMPLSKVEYETIIGIANGCR